MDETAESTTLQFRGVALLKRRWAAQPIHIRLYQAGLALVLVGVLMMAASLDPLGEQIAFGAAVGALTIGFLKDSYGWVAPHLELRPVKFAATVFGAICAAVATGLSQVTIGSATGQDPTLFPTTIAVLATISFAYVIASVVVAIGMVALTLIFAWWIFVSIVDQIIAGVINFANMLRGRLPVQSKAPSEGADQEVRVFGLPVNVVRAAAAFIVLWSCSYLLQSSSAVSHGVRWIAGASAYQFDLHADKSCSSIPGDRIRRINDTIVVIGRHTSSGFAFARKRCDLAEEAIKLPPPHREITHPVR